MQSRGHNLHKLLYTIEDLKVRVSTPTLTIYRRSPGNSPGNQPGNNTGKKVMQSRIPTTTAPNESKKENTRITTNQMLSNSYKQDNFLRGSSVTRPLQGWKPRNTPDSGLAGISPGVPRGGMSPLFPTYPNTFHLRDAIMNSSRLPGSNPVGNSSRSNRQRI